MTLPDSHRDLLERPLPVVLVTLMADGRPQASVVWACLDGDHVLVNTERGRRKEQNLIADPRCTLLVVDPDDQHRYVEIRANVVEITEEGALDHRAALDRAYLGPDHVTDPTLDRAQRVIVRLAACRVHAYG